MKPPKMSLLKGALLPLCGAAALLFSVASCSKNENSISNDAPAETEHIKELKQFVATSTGMPLETVVYSKADNQFVLDGDQLFDVADIEARFNEEAAIEGRIMQRRNTYVVSRTKAPTITLYVDPAVPSVWLSSLDAAIANWNNAGCLLHITRISTNTANITVKTNYSASSTVASASSPDISGNAGKIITINTYKNNLEESKKIFALTHEMGHAFGFTHTNGTYGALIAGTPVTDNASIMYSYVLNWAGFSSYDRIAFTTVYPK
jgi:hypothetical protein